MIIQQYHCVQEFYVRMFAEDFDTCFLGELRYLHVRILGTGYRLMFLSYRKIVCQLFGRNSKPGYLVKPNGIKCSIIFDNTFEVQGDLLPF